MPAAPEGARARVQALLDPEREHRPLGVRAERLIPRGVRARARRGACVEGLWPAARAPRQRIASNGRERVRERLLFIYYLNNTLLLY